MHFCSSVCVSTCVCVLLEAQLSEKYVSVCASESVYVVCMHSSHRGSTLSQYAALFNVSATIQPRKLCALQIIISLLPLWIHPYFLFRMVCACAPVCVCV